ncbi:hypothetical protein SXCC_00377 [Gluconacetobacter sp. SXCC-1]|nr:hypothetical protein SXCC_00377 [Gluconacetobacter sp. SXCC-1]
MLECDMVWRTVGYGIGLGGYGAGPVCRPVFWLVKKAGNVEGGGAGQQCFAVSIASLWKKPALFVTRLERAVCSVPIGDVSVPAVSYTTDL